MYADHQLTFLIRRWANGDTSLPVVTRLRESGFDDDATAIARLALRDPECLDRDSLELALREIASAPNGWLDALAEFARTPSEERWTELMRFVPEEVFYQRLRDTTETLVRLGCDGNTLFRCTARIGMHSGIFDLATSGLVDPQVIEERGAGSPARSVWLGLAAQAAFARGDRFGVLRYLREACRREDAFLAWASISEIRRTADASLNAELDRLGIDQV